MAYTAGVYRGGLQQRATWASLGSMELDILGDLRGQ